ncbi:hypothetical protein A8F94_09640 [Bacillus sp. FJAT-27225]|uniref:hypothetical protein n=1 Tax=Bacillus sp. FJAT-27225 TaxID=1743144 RepID=UPI00080C2F14|nr:hypothetical protein [Bacillus sp. FJAT-27225]OCA88071.1 hypothetical protein A8F94_09640 [Bacillus sp. FJAT-27225]
MKKKPLILAAFLLAAAAALFIIKSNTLLLDSKASAEMDIRDYPYDANYSDPKTLVRAADTIFS